MVKMGFNRIATLDLIKAYDRRTLWSDFGTRVETNLLDLLLACLKELTIVTKGDVTGTKAAQKTGLTQTAPLSQILFLIYT